MKFYLFHKRKTSLPCHKMVTVKKKTKPKKTMKLHSATNFSQNPCLKALSPKSVLFAKRESNKC